jgi:hypothetical protein
MRCRHSLDASTAPNRLTVSPRGTDSANYEDMVMQPPTIDDPVVAVVTGNTLVTHH